MRSPLLLIALLCGTPVISVTAWAADTAPVSLTIQNQQFEPQHLTLPGGIKIKILIRNQDSVPVEFESTDLSREVVIPAHAETAIFIGPLDAGSYQFFNDFNRDMQGAIVVPSAAR